MNPDPNVAAVIRQYVDAVAASLKKDPVERREAMLRAIREHINEALAVRTAGRPATPQDAYAVLSTHSGDVQEIDLFKKRESAERHCEGNGGIVVGLAAIAAQAQKEPNNG